MIKYVVENRDLDTGIWMNLSDFQTLKEARRDLKLAREHFIKKVQLRIVKVVVKEIRKVVK